MGAGVKKDSRSLGNGGDVGQSASLIESAGGLVVVSIVLHVHTSEPEK